MEFSQGGVSPNNLFKNDNNNTRLLTDDLSITEIKKIYRKFANFLLQLFKLDFDYIRNLHSLSVNLSFPTQLLTGKIHDILQTRGVDTFRAFT
jgi:hypothetical protein